MRCAIYTRKSHDDRSDSQLTSTTRQRELCRAYIDSQAEAGWIVVADYEDVGQSGGTIERPALRNLLTDIDAGLIDIIVVYKIDRLSRSLRDFLNLVERFDQADATFVSVTQAFSTTSSMGRLTLNVLLSFAQFEREMIGERARDWKAGARDRGLWTSGPPPFGYRVRDLRLEPDPERANVVREVYRAFNRGSTFADIRRMLNDRGHRNRLGNEIDGRMVKAMLSSPVYRGHLTYRGQAIPGTHCAIVSVGQWNAAQRRLAR